MKILKSTFVVIATFGCAIAYSLCTYNTGPLAPCPDDWDPVCSGLPYATGNYSAPIFQCYTSGTSCCTCTKRQKECANPWPSTHKFWIDCSKPATDNNAVCDGGDKCLELGDPGGGGA